MPTPDAIDASQQFRRRLEREENAAFARMSRIYARIITALSEEIQKLAADIATATADAEQVTVSRDGKTITVDKKRVQLARMQRILNQLEEQIIRFGGTVQSEVALAQALGIDQATQDALALMELSLPDLPPEVSDALRTSFTRLPSEAVEAAVGLLDDTSPLAINLTEKFGQSVRDQVERHLLEGIAFGRNPRVIARRLAQNLEGRAGLGLKWAMTTVRTAQIKSYQTATHMTYAANDDIIKGWVWWSALDSRTCLSCLSNHGKTFPLDQRLNDHHNGRCTAIPETITYADLGLNIPTPERETITGEQWFRQQPVERQREIMGVDKYEAWQDGKFKFDDLTTTYDDEVYGELRREATLKELV